MVSFESICLSSCSCAHYLFDSYGCSGVKVSKSRKQFMVSSILPKNKRKLFELRENLGDHKLLSRFTDLQWHRNGSALASKNVGKSHWTFCITHSPAPLFTLPLLGDNNRERAHQKHPFLKGQIYFVMGFFMDFNWKLNTATVQCTFT